VTADQQNALALAKDLAPTASNIENVARETSAAAASWAFSQWRLRQRGLSKFTAAGEMLFTQDALEMASHEDIAAYHASQFPKDELIVDMTVGIGGDTIALARRGRTIGYELDPERAECAMHNLRVHGFDTEVIVGECLSADWKSDYALCDPSRRAAGKRRLGVDSFQPNPFAIARRFQSLRLGCIKLSPMIEDSVLEQLGRRVEFIGHQSECKEALCWTGDKARPGRFAVLIETGERLAAGGQPEKVNEPMRYIFEAHPAAIRAHCLRPICKILRAQALGDSNGYLTGPEPSQSIWVRAYRLLRSGRLDTRRLRADLAALEARIAEVKVRAKFDGEKLLKSLKPAGPRQVSLLVYPIGKSLRYALAEVVGQ
jgi:hypothetical protein